MPKTNLLAPLHPGEVLREEYLVPLGINPYELAASMRVSRVHVERLLREEISVTLDTALRLGAYFGTTPEFWLDIQVRFDLEAVQKKTLAAS